MTRGNFFLRKIGLFRFLSDKPWIIFTIVCVTYFAYIINMLGPLETYLTAPIAKYDYGFHFGKALNSYEALVAHGHFWDYNPFFAGGFPEGVRLGISSHLYALSMFLGSLMPKHLIFNLVNGMIFILIPILLYILGRRVLGSRNLSLLYSSFTLSLFLSQEIFREFIIIGHLTFVLACLTALLSCSYLNSFLLTKSKSSFFSYWIYASISFMIHAASPVIVIVLCLSILLYHVKFFKDLKCCLLVFLGGILAVIPNVIWIYPLIDFFHNHGSWAQFLQTDSLFVWRQILDIPTLVIIVLMIYLIVLRKMRLRGEHIFGLIVLMIVSCLGSQIGMKNIQPARFFIPFILLLSLSISKKQLAIGSFVSIVFAMFLPWPTFGGGGFDKKVSDLRYYLREVSGDGRVALQNYSDLEYSGSRVALFLGEGGQVSFSTGIFPFPPTSYSYTNFTRDRIFGLGFSEVDKIKERLEIYNVAHLVVVNTLTKEIFDNLQDFERVKAFGHIVVYKYLRSKKSYCYRCSARIVVDQNSIVVEDAKARDFILKFHFIKNMKVEHTSAEIEPYLWRDDPNPFIRVKRWSPGKLRIIF